MIDAWKMGEKHKRAYDTDKNVQHISVEFSVTNWTFSDHEGPALGGPPNKTLQPPIRARR